MLTWSGSLEHGSRPADAVLLGDTAAYVEGALAAGVRVIAVATGRTSAQDLHAAGADMVLTDLSTTKALVDLVTAR